MDSPLLRERTQSANEFLPFWFIFRICSNSVSVFFHHTDSHIRSNHSPDAAISTSLASEKTMYQVSSDKLSLECEYCNIYHNVVNSIHSVIRILNQKLLLAKLCDERLCDELLLPVDEADMISKPDLIYINECSESNIRNGSLDLINSCGWKIRSKRRIRPFMRHTLITDKKKVTVSDQKLKTCSNTSSNGVGKSNCTKLSTAYDTTKHPVNLSCDQLKVLTQHENWPPGVFACPVQMTSYIRLHPRVFLNSQMYPVEKGRRIIPALRQLLENLAITNRPNMFFLIDHPSKPDSNSIATRRKKHTYCDSEVRSGHSIAEYSQQPIFYMLLKEVTTSAFYLNVNQVHQINK
ncbi:unnamed protein product [Heterobilharzia americana]|nr:unnamed protein product [Heterobilharzia americana]